MGVLYHIKQLANSPLKQVIFCSLVSVLLNQKTTRLRRIMNKITLAILAMMVLTINADHCFAPCNIKSRGSGGGMRFEMATLGDFQDYGAPRIGINGLPITNYHCVMKCANKLSLATYGAILQPGFEREYNHECALIENLDYCVQLWKVMNDVDCEEPIRDMVRNTFGENDASCMRTYVSNLREITASNGTKTDSEIQNFWNIFNQIWDVSMNVIIRNMTSEL